MMAEALYKQLIKTDRQFNVILNFIQTTCEIFWACDEQVRKEENLHFQSVEQNQLGS